jgi:hypothetical protein
VLIDRSEKDLPFTPFAVYKTVVKNYTPEECPLCESGVQLQKPGGV